MPMQCPGGAELRTPHPARSQDHHGDCGDVVARDVAQLLAGADERARLVLGVGPAWVPLPGQACPDCRRRTVEAEVSADDEREWTARCGNGCWIRPAEEVCRERSDVFALIRSVRRQYEKRSHDLLVITVATRREIRPRARKALSNDRRMSI
jgi:hypothetical protein